MGYKAHEEKFFPFRLMPYPPLPKPPSRLCRLFFLPKPNGGGSGGGERSLGAVEANVELSNTFLEGKYFAKLLLATVKLARCVF